MTELDRRFGVVPRHNTDLGDQVGLLSESARGRVRRQLHLLNARFPQVHFSIFARKVPNRPPRTYGFWLFNRCRFHDVGANQGRCFSLLLVFNLADQTASLTGGYGLEPICTEEDMQAFLAAAAPYWKEGQYEKGIMILLGKLTAHLKALATGTTPSNQEKENRLPMEMFA